MWPSEIKMKYRYAVMYSDPAGHQWNKYFETEVEANTYADEQSKLGAYCIVAEIKKAYEPYKMNTKRILG